MNQTKALYKFVVIYLYLVLFGGFFLKIAGFSNELGLKLMACLDIVPLVVFFFSNPSFYRKGVNLFKTTSFWFAWIILLGLLVLTAYLHRGNISPSIIHIGALLRYIPLAYIILSLSSKINIGDKLISHLKAITTIILIISTICIFMGSSAELLLPVMSKDATGLREISSGYHSAIFPNTIDLGFLLVLLFIVWSNDKNFGLFKYILFSLWTGLCIFKTGSATATAVFCLILFLRLTKNNKILRYAFVSFGLAIVIALYFRYQYEVSLVIENMQLSRLGIISQTAPDFIKELSFDTFFGIGNDSDVVLKKVNSYPEKVHLLYYTDGLSAFGDVYWVALLIFHGIFGLLIIGYIFYKIYNGICIYNIHDKDFNFKRIIKWSYISIFLLGFMNQVLVVKTFAIIFWIMVAITYSKITKTRVNESSATQQLRLP